MTQELLAPLSSVIGLLVGAPPDRPQDAEPRQCEARRSAVLYSRIAEINISSSASQLRDQIGSIGNDAGFEFSAVTLLLPIPGERCRVIGVSNLPDEYFSIGFPGWIPSGQKLDDPLAKHSREEVTPLFWNRSTYHEAGMVDRWEKMDSMGLSSGLVQPLHLAAGKSIIIGFGTGKNLQTDSPPLGAIVSAVQLLAAYIVDATERILVPIAKSVNPGSTYIEASSLECSVAADRRQLQSKLTARQIECLQWSAAGKSARDIAQILSISQSAVSKHIQGALTSLNCSNKSGAVSKAIALGLVK